MKKIVTLAAVLLAFSATSVFAWASATYQTTGTVGSTQTAEVKLSKNVSISYTSQATGLGYSVATYHSSGTKTYGSSSGDSKIFTNDATAVAAPTAPSGTASADFSSWTAL